MGQNGSGRVRPGLQSIGTPPSSNNFPSVFVEAQYLPHASFVPSAHSFPMLGKHSGLSSLPSVDPEHSGDHDFPVEAFSSAIS